MASEPGGRADKLGNEFERLCAVRHLIELVEGSATTFKLEALGDDERGTDFWVGRPNGTLEAHQCKRENVTSGKWTVSDLARKRILSDAKYQLERKPSSLFIFTSGDKVTHLSDLAERAKRCESPSDFVKYLTSTSEELKKEFNLLCQKLEIDSTTSEGAEKVVDFLRRFRPEIVDKSSLIYDVQERASRWFTGKPEDVVSSLKDLFDKSIGRVLSEKDVIESLPNGSRSRDLARDPTINIIIDEIKTRFISSYKHLLIGDNTLGRSETNEIISMLASDKGSRLILVHGQGGGWKERCHIRSR